MANSEDESVMGYCKYKLCCSSSWVTVDDIKPFCHMVSSFWSTLQSVRDQIKVEQPDELEEDKHLAPADAKGVCTAIMEPATNQYGVPSRDSFSASFNGTCSRFTPHGNQPRYRTYKVPSPPLLSLPQREPMPPSFLIHRPPPSYPEQRLQQIYSSFTSPSGRIENSSNDDTNGSDEEELGGESAQHTQDESLGESIVCASKKCEQGTRFTPRQVCTLVDNWVSLIKKLESTDSLKYWKIIQEKVNKCGSQKSVRQIKKKMIALKRKYKEVKMNNNKSGWVRKTCKFYEAIDSVLGTRYVVLMPEAASSGRPTDRATDDSVAENPADTTVTPPATPIPNENDKCEERTKRKKTKHDAATVMKDTMFQMQERQERYMETLVRRMEAVEERAQERNNEFLLKLVEAFRK